MSQLDRFRAGRPSGPQALPEGKQSFYAPYRLKDGRRFIEIRRPVPNTTTCPANHGITNVRAAFGECIILEYGREMRVIIDGKNLDDLLAALLEWRVEFLQQFDEGRHAPPAAGEPVITSINIYTADDLPKSQDRIH